MDLLENKKYPVRRSGGLVGTKKFFSKDLNISFHFMIYSYNLDKDEHLKDGHILRIEIYLITAEGKSSKMGEDYRTFADFEIELRPGGEIDNKTFQKISTTIIEYFDSVEVKQGNPDDEMIQDIKPISKPEPPLQAHFDREKKKNRYDN